MRLFAYADGAVLLLVLFTFSRDWLIPSLIWLAANAAFFSWEIRKSVKARLSMTSPASIEAARRSRGEFSRRIVRLLPLNIAAALGFVVAGFYSRVGFIAAAIMFLLCAVLVVLARKLRD